jgi:NAD(P)-dependent dehydrogenase (short-subunit alcohol dehydrogenase family)
MAQSIALVTGANKGIGLETARQLGSRGTTVLVAARDAGRGRDAEGVLRAEGIDARFICLDVTSEDDARKAAERIDAEFGLLDILVNNAGIATSGGLPSETSVPGMRGVLETNVLGVITVTNAMLPLLRRSAAGRIVNVSSELGSVTLMSDTPGPMRQLPPSVTYPVSKSALNMVTAMYAKELAETLVKVNAANPGYCATDLNGHTGSARRQRALRSACTWPRCLRTALPARSGGTAGAAVRPEIMTCCPGDFAW